MHGLENRQAGNPRLGSSNLPPSVGFPVDGAARMSGYWRELARAVKWPSKEAWSRSDLRPVDIGRAAANGPVLIRPVCDQRGTGRSLQGLIGEQ